MPVIIWDLDGTLFDTHLQMSSHLSHRYMREEMYNIKLFPDAIQALNIKAVHILVTYDEDVEWQQKKIDALGIRDVFGEIHIVTIITEKLEVMRKIKDRYPAKDFYVVGDRIDQEISFGNQLGMTTILCPRGRHMFRVPKDEYEHPDYTIKDLTELNGIIKQ